MSAPDQPPAAADRDPVDEFDWIDRCLRPLAAGAPEAFGLLDDAAAIPGRPGFDLIISKDAIVEGVHFLPTDPLDRVARKLLRTNLSDLAAKGAEPYGYFLAIAWPPNSGWERRRAFAAGLADDQAAFGLKLLGGDTVSTPGPLMASATILGWSPQGRMVPRGGARPGDVVLVTGSIGDGGLGLKAARGEGLGVPDVEAAWLKERYQLPRPRLGLGEALRTRAHAAADVSDGLIADAGRIAEASGVRLTIDLARMPLSGAAAQWLVLQPDSVEARAALAASGDDYEILCTALPLAAPHLQAAAKALGLPLTEIGTVSAGSGVEVLAGVRRIRVQNRGWRHGR
ncbi:MAG TPA: thiamine-phosphate kinase [Caulobacteraceae bacterium]|jgi:thiamine-monophosphate kinase|nr:thiamine-phosphate kinase [Caulobacteraceae bacterium]